MTTKDITPVSVQIGSVSFDFEIEYEPQAIELLASTDTMRDPVARAIHLGLRCSAQSLADNIQYAEVLLDGQRLENTEADDPPQ